MSDMPSSMQDIESAKSRAGRGDLDGALAVLEQVLSREPDHRGALFEAGRILYDQRKHAAAERMFRRVLAAGAHDGSTLMLAKIFRETARAADAYGYFAAMIEGRMLPAETARELAELFRDARRYETAHALYERAREQTPGDPEPALRAAHLGNYLGRSAQAREAVEPWLAPGRGLSAVDRNRALNEWEIATRQTVLRSLPRILLLTLTTRCNLDCPMCGRSRQPWDIPDRVRDEILSLIPTLELATWQGGEVFLYPHFRMFLEEAQKNPALKQIIITNGLLLDDEWAAALAAQHSVDLTISIDSVDPRTYARIRQGGDIRTLTENVRRLSAHRAKGRAHMTLALRSTVMKSNYREMEDLLEFAHEHGFNVLQLMPLNGDWDQGNIYARQDQEALSFIAGARERVRERAAAYGIRLLDWLPASPPAEMCGAPVTEEAFPDPHLSPPASVESPPLRCFRPWRQIAVNVEGNVFPECLCQEPVGTLLKDGVTGVWNNPAMQEYRDRLIAGRGDLCNRACLAGEIPAEHLKFICE